MQTQLYKCLFNVVITRLMFKSKNNCSVDLYLTHQAINKKIFFKCLLQENRNYFSGVYAKLSRQEFHVRTAAVASKYSTFD